MVLRCVVGGCSNTKQNNAVTLHTFPKDIKTAKLWRSFVLKSRKWDLSAEQAQKSRTQICSDHFEDRCYDSSQLMQIRSGFAIQLRIQPGAVPSILTKDVPECSPRKKARRENTVKKLDLARLRVSLNRSKKALGASASLNVPEQLEPLDLSIHQRNENRENPVPLVDVNTVPPVNAPPVDVNPPVDVPPMDGDAVSPEDGPPVGLNVVPAVNAPPVDINPPVDVPPMDVDAAPPGDGPPVDLNEVPPVDVNPPVDVPPMDVHAAPPVDGPPVDLNEVPPVDVNLPVHVPPMDVDAIPPVDGPAVDLNVVPPVDVPPMDVYAVSPVDGPPVNVAPPADVLPVNVNVIPPVAVVSVSLQSNVNKPITLPLLWLENYKCSGTQTCASDYTDEPNDQDTCEDNGDQDSVPPSMPLPPRPRRSVIRPTLLQDILDKDPYAKCEDSDDINSDDDASDCTYFVSGESSSTSANDSPDRPMKKMHVKKLVKKEESAQERDDNRIFLVYEVMLMKLLTICMICRKDAIPIIKRFMGTMVYIKQVCSNKSCRGYEWQSQPMVGRIPKGNLVLSSAILFSGSLASKVMRLFQFMNVRCYCVTTFYDHQRKYLHGAIQTVWRRKQHELISTVAEETTIAGDARCDSMGHTAKYGSYTFLDLGRNKVICSELVQKNEVKSSYHMELEGLKRCKNTLLDGSKLEDGTSKIRILNLVTDRHPQINKWIRENWAGVTHYFDIWHISKGLKKKLEILAKKFEDLRAWFKAIIIHLYWSGTTSRGDGDLAEAKWRSLFNHVANIHRHDTDIFPTCQHGVIENPKRWLTPGTKQYEDLMLVLDSKRLIADVRRMSPVGQTGSLEGFHSVVNHFAPKMIHFGYAGMTSRVLLAAMYYNENAGRAIAKNKRGEKQLNVTYPRAKSGEPTLRVLTVKPTFIYNEELMTEVFRLVLNQNEARQWEVTIKASTPHAPSNDHPQADKHDLYNRLFTRFPDRFVD